MEEINPCEDIKGYMNDVKGIAIPFQKKHYHNGDNIPWMFYSSCGLRLGNSSPCTCLTVSPAGMFA